MTSHLFYLAFVTCLIVSPLPTSGTNIWTDILTCVKALENQTLSENGNFTVNSTANGTSMEEPADQQFSMMKLFSIICGDKDGFVQCLDTSLKQSSDSVTQMVGSLFDPKMVTLAYAGLCSNISAIEQGGGDVLSCLSKVRMAPCQNEMADYFFYMGVVKKFAPPSEQLSRTTMETLLCSVTFQRRQCEVKALRQCSASLADVMEQFYRQTQPDACAALDKENELNQENNVQQ
ncbi:unnamed protein product [Lymnaea stagnalis]|uniref:Uncharacterized protein n=1 Tax=Lymnaea stagnalis TaxID=6523 RepID=A0AAV2I6R2_LYMST